MGPLTARARTAQAVLRTYGARGAAQRARYEIERRAGAFRADGVAGRPRWPGFRLAAALDLGELAGRYARLPAAGHLREAVEGEADRILGGEQRLYGGAWLAVGWPPRWHTGPFDGVAWPADAHWTAIGDDDPARGDVKDVWELSRLGAVAVLARAHVAGGDDRYAQAAWDLVDDWVSHHPVGYGPAWMSGQEVAIRGIALQLLLLAVGEHGASTRARVERVGGVLGRSVQRVERTLHYALSQRNNHAVVELVFLWTTAALVPMLPGRERRLRSAARELRRCVADQFYLGGGYAQHSYTYQRLAVQALLWLVRVADLAGVAVPDGVVDAVRRSQALLHAVQEHSSGWLPNLGSNDGALLLPLTTCEYRDFRPVVQASGLATGAGRVYEPGPWDEEAVWLAPGFDAPHVERPRVEATDTVGGHVTTRGAGSFALLRVPSYRHRPGHSDELHLDLWVGGVNVAPDPGTYRYTAPAPWRNGLATRRVHNTFSPHGVTEARLGRFLPLDWPEAKLLARVDEQEGCVLVAEVRFPQAQVRHRRAVARAGDRYVVVDTADGDGVVHWNLAPLDWEAAVDGDGAVLSAPGLVTVKVTARGAAITWRPAEEARPDDIVGWVSRHYGERTAVPVVEVNLPAGGVAVTEFVPDGQASGRLDLDAARALLDGGEEPMSRATGLLRLLEP